MDSITNAITKASLASLLARNTTTGTRELAAVYGVLRTLLLTKFGGHRGLARTIRRVERRPESVYVKQKLSEKLSKVNAAIDLEVLRASAALELEIRHVALSVAGMSDTGTDEASGRAIVVTAYSGADELVTAFEPQTGYRLCFRVAAQSAHSLVEGNTEIDDVPEGGLDARWIVTSANVELLRVSHGGSVTRGSGAWRAKFDLRIPPHGDSGSVMLDVRTTSSTGELTLTLLVGGDEYRNLTIRLGIGAEVENDIIATAPRHLNLPATHEWTTPPEHLRVIVGHGLATVTGTRDYPDALWKASSTVLNNPIIRVRQALEKFRVAAEPHLDELDCLDMAKRLRRQAWRLCGRWDSIRGAPEPARAAEMSVLARSEQLRALAREGYQLFNACFPSDSPLRAIIEQLAPGSRVDFCWTRRGEGGWVSHVPWALMYLDPVKSSEAVDCERFLGLRLRIGSKAWEPNAPSRALGAPSAVNSLNFLYWGTDPEDEVAREAQWQRKRFGRWPRQRVIPELHGEDPQHQVILALEELKPEPAGVLYFYCHCNLPAPTEPVFQFARGGKASELVKVNDMFQGRIAAGPLVFANACMTSASDPHGTSELEHRFFDRDIRAFLGTETQVPVKLASRFAWLFFQFFLRRIDPSPMAAGEALAQARQFLWTQYRNPGGLFYCLVNQYSLYLASDEELAQLPRSA